VPYNHVLHGLCIASSLTFSISLLEAGQVRRQPGQGQPTVPVTVALKVGAEPFTSSAAGQCTHAPTASIYSVLSEMWTVRQQEEGRSIQLTLWHPKDGTADMFSLSVNGKASVQVSTVRGGTQSGSGTVKLERAEKGGTFTVSAKAKSGEAITGTIQCSAFTAAIAEGGL
jgi:hypothetical protein